VLVLQNVIVNGELPRTNTHTHTCSSSVELWHLHEMLTYTYTYKYVTHGLPCYLNRSDVILHTVIYHTGLCMIDCGGNKMISVCNSVWSRQWDWLFTRNRVLSLWLVFGFVSVWMGMRVTVLRQSLPMLTLSS